MMQATEQRYYSSEEYLAIEEAADFHSEYIDGLIIPMTGGSTNHNHLAGNRPAGMIFGLPDDVEYDEEDESIKFETIPFEISLAALYKRVKFETAS